MKLLNKLEQINEDIEGINKTISNLLSEQTANPLINWWLRRKIRKSLTPDLNNDDSFSDAWDKWDDSDKKETDIKLIAINPKGNFMNIVNIEDLLYEHSSITEILKLWFLNYKKPGKMVFIKYLNKPESEGIIEKAHLKWKRNFTKSN